MIQDKSVLAIIPARGGSKGLPGKNIKPLCGKPLLAWTIEVARQSQFIDHVIISTDSQEIAAVAEEYGAEVPFMRPNDLATDEATSVEVVLHAIEQCQGYDYVVLLQPTSPLREVADIDACIEKTLCHDGHGCFSVSRHTKPLSWLCTLQNGAVHFRQELVAQRQLAEDYYLPNGAVYVVKTTWFKDNATFVESGMLGHIMPEERSIDIDTILDFTVAEQMLAYNL